jgi:hypothetical protein
LLVTGLPLSLTVTPNENVPLVRVVPEMMPVVDKLNPVGRLPEVIVHV